MPEPASAQLRRLHEDIVRPEVLSNPDETEESPNAILRAAEDAKSSLDSALPALADLVASVEECTSLHCRPGGLVWQGVTSAPCRCSHCTSLAALVVALAAKP